MNVLEMTPACEPLVREIARRRGCFVWPVTGAALAAYLLALVTLSYWPALVGVKVWGAINIAYVIVQVQFVLTFSVALAYTAWARRRIDPLTRDAHSALNAANRSTAAARAA